MYQHKLTPGDNVLDSVGEMRRSEWRSALYGRVLERQLKADALVRKAPPVARRSRYGHPHLLLYLMQANTLIDALALTLAVLLANRQID